MAETRLSARSPAAGLLPEAAGTVTLSEAAMTPIWAVMPYRGQTAALSKAMEKAHGLTFPGPGTVAAKGDLRAAWSGLDQCFVIGGTPDGKLARHAALVDQSDGWAHLIFEGADAEAVLARLVPVDLSKDRAIRTALGHMQALILRDDATRFEIFVFRSMVATAVHDLTRAMRMVAARAAL